MTVCFDVLPNATREIIENVEYMEVIMKAHKGRITRFYSVCTTDGKKRNLKYKDVMLYWIRE